MENQGVDTLKAGMSEEEYYYLVDMTATSAVLFTALNKVYNRCLDLTVVHSNIERLNVFQGIMGKSVVQSRRLLMWSRTNLEMKRFPVDQNEVEDAWLLAEEHRDLAVSLGERYKWLMSEKNDIYASLECKAELDVASEKAVHMFGLLIRTRLAVSEVDGKANPVFLTLTQEA